MSTKHLPDRNWVKLKTHTFMINLDGEKPQNHETKLYPTCPGACTVTTPPSLSPPARCRYSPHRERVVKCLLILRFVAPFPFPFLPISLARFINACSSRRGYCGVFPKNLGINITTPMKGTCDTCKTRGSKQTAFTAPNISEWNTLEKSRNVED